MTRTNKQIDQTNNAVSSDLIIGNDRVVIFGLCRAAAAQGGLVVRGRFQFDTLKRKVMEVKQRYMTK